MKTEQLLNPLYIEQYGVTYVNPYDFSELTSRYGAKDTRNILTIDYDKMLLLGQYDKTYQLKPATRAHFKPFYFLESPLATYDDVMEMMLVDETRYGVSIYKDLRITRAIVNVVSVSDHRTPRKKRGWFSGGNGGGSDYAAMASGFWWGTMAGDDFDI